MISLRFVGLLLVSFSLSACAPVVYDATYSEHRPSASRHTSYPSHRAASYQVVSPVHVTLSAGSTYAGLRFQSIQFVIADGEYREVSVVTRRGRPLRFFAHYSNKYLHFDGRQACSNRQGSSGFHYDQRWSDGYSYTNVNVGNNVVFPGVNLNIRNTVKRQGVVRPAVGRLEKNIVHHEKQKPSDKFRSTLSPKTAGKTKSHQLRSHRSSGHNGASGRIGSKRGPVPLDPINSETMTRPSIVSEVATYSDKEVRGDKAVKRRDLNPSGGSISKRTKTDSSTKSQVAIDSRNFRQKTLPAKGSSMRGNLKTEQHKGDDNGRPEAINKSHRSKIFDKKNKPAVGRKPSTEVVLDYGGRLDTDDVYLSKGNGRRDLKQK